MQYFKYLNDINSNICDKMLFKQPENLNKNTDLDKLRYSLGALLYIPAIQEKMLNNVLDKKIKDLCTFAICLEDSVGDSGEKEAIENLNLFLDRLDLRIKENKLNINEIPLIFIRPKNEKCLKQISPIIKEYQHLLVGIVIPKATSERIDSFLDILNENNLESLYLLPIIESPEFIQSHTKNEAFIKMAFVINKYKDRILNIRIGVTDILGYYGIRREKNLSIYDSVIYKMFVSDIISYLQHLEIPISGGVSEFFNLNDLETLKAYEKEMQLDRLNGLIGKTVIHPKQITAVQLFNIVSYEDYIDAKSILENTNNKFGALGSVNATRMNEVKPHFKWATKIIKLASIYGVYNEDYNFKKASQEILNLLHD